MRMLMQRRNENMLNELRTIAIAQDDGAPRSSLRGV